MNKISKGKAIGLLSLGLASVALGSVGFAAWVVSGTTNPISNNVETTVGEISDQRIQMTAEIAEGKLAFDSKISNEGPITSTENNEDLVFSISYTLSCGAGLTNGAKATWSVAIPAALTTTKNYIGFSKATSDETGNNVVEDVTVTAGNQTSGTIYFHMAWGTAFGGMNPSDLTEAKMTEKGLNLDQVIKDLKDLKTLVAEPANKIAVTFTAAANAA